MAQEPTAADRAHAARVYAFTATAALVTAIAVLAIAIASVATDAFGDGIQASALTFVLSGLLFGFAAYLRWLRERLLRE